MLIRHGSSICTKGCNLPSSGQWGSTVTGRLLNCATPSFLLSNCNWWRVQWSSQVTARRKVFFLAIAGRPYHAILCQRMFFSDLYWPVWDCLSKCSYCVAFLMMFVSWWMHLRNSWLVRQPVGEMVSSLIIDLHSEGSTGPTGPTGLRVSRLALTWFVSWVRGFCCKVEGAFLA